MGGGGGAGQSSDAVEVERYEVVSSLVRFAECIRNADSMGIEF